MDTTEGFTFATTSDTEGRRGAAVAGGDMIDVTVAVGEGVEVTVGVAVGSTSVKHARMTKGSIPIKRTSPLKRLGKRDLCGDGSLNHRMADKIVEMVPKDLLRNQ